MRSERCYHEENFCHFSDYHYVQLGYAFRRVQYAKQSVRKRRNDSDCGE